MARGIAAFVMTIGVVMSLTSCFMFPNLPIERSGAMAVVNGQVLLGWCDDREAWNKLRVSFWSTASEEVYSFMKAEGEYAVGEGEPVLNLSNLPGSMSVLNREDIDSARVNRVTVTFSKQYEGPRIFQFDFEPGQLDSWPADRWLESSGSWRDSMCE